MKRVLNFGSLNIDHVYRVGHFVRPGETLLANTYQVFAGGKGANQSAALALAGAQVSHGGLMGPEGGWLADKLAGLGVDTRFITVSTISTGHALIQVDDVGENAIVLYPGANHGLTQEKVDTALKDFTADDVLLLQNETNQIAYLMRQANACGMRIYFNPAPFTPQILQYPLELVDTFILNRTEAIGLAGAGQADALLAALTRRYVNSTFILTLGKDGAYYRSKRETLQHPARPIDSVDTTGAGDTFIGYFLASITKGHTASQAMDLATKAAALCVSLPGAMDSIPAVAQVETWT
jgi:ribokinase